MTYERTIRMFYAYRFVSSFFLIGPIITLFFLEFIPFAQLGIVFAAGVATAFLFEIPSGVWADHLGRKYAVAFGTRCFAAARALPHRVRVSRSERSSLLGSSVASDRRSSRVRIRRSCMIACSRRADRKEKLSREGVR
jgi:MFS family permease